MRPILKNATLCVCLLFTCLSIASAATITSPDGNVALEFHVKDFDSAKGCAVYSISYRGKTVVNESKLALDIEGGPLGCGLGIVRSSTRENSATWKPVYGERESVNDNYRELTVELRETAVPHRLLQLTFRVYDEGAAFCYTIPKQDAMQEVSISAEKSEFRFPADHTAWAVYTAQGVYSKVSLSSIKPGCERPLTIRADDKTYLAVAEARLVDYARMKLGPLAGCPNALVSELSSSVHSQLPLTTPWRVMMTADSPGQLLENNDIILNLNDPCAIADTSWIKPGKVLREVTLTTVGGKACVDFAVKHNLQYVEYDAGWYGHEHSDASDATTVTVDSKRSPGPLDLPEVIRYAKDRDIGIILYVNRRSLERQLDEVLPLLQKWGIKGVKYGFVNVGSQRWTSWLHEAVRKAAKYRLVIDVHDEYRPTGYSRTYPNFMTQEGIGGDETSPSNEQTLNILFTRMIAGAGDNTICYYSKRVAQNTTHAYQLAKAVCMYSPLQFLYWYDRPTASPAKKGGADNTEAQMGDEPEIEFFDAVPTVWDDTKVLAGKIGCFAVIARRSGKDWFVGCMNAKTPRMLDVPLSFLEKGKKYTAHVYSHDPSVETRTHVKIDRLPVDSTSVLKANLAGNDGQAIRIVAASSSQ